MHKLLIFYLLFHQNLIIILVLERKWLRISESVTCTIIMLGKFQGNESFRIQIASLFPISWMFISSLTVNYWRHRPRLLQHLMGNCSTECTSPVSFFKMFHVVVFVLSDFAISVNVMLLFSFITFLRVLQYWI
jgi:hypothetical protein